MAGPPAGSCSHWQHFLHLDGRCWHLQENTVLRLAICSFLFSAKGFLFGQSAELSGLVKDPSGGVVANASLQLRNQDTGALQQTSTNADGFYSFPGLKPGTYEATVQAERFRTLTREAIVLNVAERGSLDFSLQLAIMAQSVTVTTTPALLNSVDPAVSTVVDRSLCRTCR